MAVFHYCTYFDKNYLYKGLALYQSMQQHLPDFTLWILSFDQETLDILDRLKLPSVRLIALEDFERGDTALLRAKQDRNPVEYYWTSTPSLPLSIVLRRQEPSLDGVVYLDADLFFYCDAAPIFTELGNGSVLIHPHRFAPQYADRASTAGISTT